jgi:hypothetical protein
MQGNEVASRQLNALLNDVDARTIFAKNGPLNWFSPSKTIKGFLKRGYLTEKQIELISKVYEQYSKFKKASKNFNSSGEGCDLAKALYGFLQNKPKNTSTKDRSRSQKFSNIIRSFSEGGMIHIGCFNAAELIILDFPKEIENKIIILERLYSARRKYLFELMQCEEKMGTQQGNK